MFAVFQLVGLTVVHAGHTPCCPIWHKATHPCRWGHAAASRQLVRRRRRHRALSRVTVLPQPCRSSFRAPYLWRRRPRSLVASKQPVPSRPVDARQRAGYRSSSPADADYHQLTWTAADDDHPQVLLR